MLRNYRYDFGGVRPPSTIPHRGLRGSVRKQGPCRPGAVVANPDSAVCATAEAHLTTRLERSLIRASFAFFAVPPACLPACLAGPHRLHAGRCSYFWAL